jgi:hypothetical protein
MDGTRQILEGPASVFEVPGVTKYITVHKALKLSTGEAVVVYSKIQGIVFSSFSHVNVF